MGQGIKEDDMTHVKRLVILLLFAAIVIFLGICLKQNPSYSPVIDSQNRVPAFSGESFFDRGEITQKRLLNHLTLIHVFATWCEACQYDHPIIMQLHKRFPTLYILGIAFQDTRPSVKQWLKNNGNPYNAIIDDSDGSVGVALGISITPDTFLVDANGYIISKKIGNLSSKTTAELMSDIIRFRSHS